MPPNAVPSVFAPGRLGPAGIGVAGRAQIIAYADDYVMLICTILPSILLLLFMRRPLRGSVMAAEPME